MPLLGSGRALAHRLEQQHRGRGGHVQRSHPPRLRYRDQGVARALHARADALLLPTQHHHRPSARRAGITPPAAPATSAERHTAPRLRGSWTWSSTTTSESGASSNEPGSAYGYGSTSATIPWWSGEPASLVSSVAGTSSALHTRCTRRLPRRASATALRP